MMTLGIWLAVLAQVHGVTGPSAAQETAPTTTRAVGSTTQPTSGPAGALSPAEARRVGALIDQLGDADPAVQETALDALREMGEKAAPYLIDRLADPAAAAVRAGCARALGLIGADLALGALIEALGDPAAAVRREAAQALGALGRLGALAPLAGTLRDLDASVRGAAALAIGQAVRIARSDRELRGEEQALAGAAVGPLVDALRDPEPGVRGNAALSLGVLRGAEALRALLLASLDRDALCRASVAQALGDLRETAAGGVLVTMLGDADGTVRRSAIDALEAITGQRLGYQPRAPVAERQAAVERWRSWWTRVKRDLERRPRPAP